MKKPRNIGHQDRGVDPEPFLDQPPDIAADEETVDGKAFRELLFGIGGLALGEKLALMRTHFLSPKRIAGLFGTLNASINIDMDGHIARVVVTKPIP